MTKKFSLQAQIQEAEREIKTRREVYPRQSYPNRVWRHRGEAQIALEIMENIKSTLEWLAENETEHAYPVASHAYLLWRLCKLSGLLPTPPGLYSRGRAMIAR